MVPCLRLSISTCFWLLPVEGEEYQELVAWEEGMVMVPCVSLGTLHLHLGTPCGIGAQWIGELHLRKVWCSA